VKVGARAFVAGGSTITRDVAADALAFGRARQETKSGEGKKLRAKLKRSRNKG
jgi:bifunctional UDP-N-acetylglucosamine pyrophosphorylase/glucosamine-1-phosphate N-acetyltransferase